MSESPLATWFRARSRGLGVFVLLLGWGMASWGYMAFLTVAPTRKPVLMVPGIFGVLVGIGFLGLILLIGGQRAADTLMRKGLGHLRYLAFLVCCVVLPSFLAFMWLRHEFSVFGYP